MRQATPLWKLLAAFFSLFLTILVWQKGLQESFDRPSVAPKLSLRQQEMSVVASHILPEPFLSLTSDDPKESLRGLLEEIPFNELDDRNKIVLAALQPTQKLRDEILKGNLTNKNIIPIQQLLLNSSEYAPKFNSNPDILAELKKDPLLYQLTCDAVNGDIYDCDFSETSKWIAIKLLTILFFPFIAVAIGLILLLMQLWVAFIKKNIPWPNQTQLPLTIVDMMLLIFGGFVVLGEVLFPAVIIPLSGFITDGLSVPVGESLRVLIGYISMTIPPLLILFQQLRKLTISEMPEGGWLQWGIKPIQKSISQAIRAWLIVIPFVLLSGWLITLFFGDPGGSNPLLDLVLNSQNKFALILLLITTVILAPAFEELIFRGALLPVLAAKFGRYGGIVLSALVFALAHLSVGELPPLFVLGVGLGILRLSSGKLLPCAVMHALWNGMTFTNLLLLAK